MLPTPHRLARTARAAAQQVEADVVPHRPTPLEAVKARRLNEAVGAADHHRRDRSCSLARTRCNSRDVRVRRSHRSALHNAFA
jgi:hypothetical protein